MKGRKQLLLMTSISVLTACGGGGGGKEESSTPAAGSVVEIAATTPGSASSSGYNTRDLAYNINIIFDNNNWSVTGVSTISAAHLTGTNSGLDVSDTDKVSSYVDGEELVLNENWDSVNGSYYTFPLTRDANIYEFKFTRGDVIVVEGSIDSLPEYIHAVGTASGNDVHIEITENSEHIYTYNAESLECKSAGDYGYYTIESNFYVGNDAVLLTDDYRKSIVDAFGVEIGDLQASYESCNVSVFLVAESQRINITKSHRNIGIHPISIHLVEVPLF